jgi:hypothetical protein
MFVWPSPRRPQGTDRMLRPAHADEVGQAVDDALRALWHRPGGASDLAFAREALAVLHARGAGAPLGLLLTEVHHQLAERRPPPGPRLRVRPSFDGKC